MDNSFIAWIFLMSFALVGPGLVLLLLAYAKGYLVGNEEVRKLPLTGDEQDYWQQTWRGGR